MLLKKFYRKDPAGENAVAGVGLIHTGTHPEQNFSARLVAQGLAQGWLAIGGGKLTLTTVDPDLESEAKLEYTIVRGPGLYCCHCAKRLEDDVTGELARGHVAEAHPGAESPDRDNPAGYRRITGYEAVLDAAQHEKYRAQPGDPLTVDAVARELVRDAKKRAAQKKGA